MHGIRDRSWGRRNVGEPDQGVPLPSPQASFLWMPLIWPDHASLAVFFEDAQGRPLHAEGKTLPVYARADQVPGVEDPLAQHMSGVSRRLRYAPGTRRAVQATLTMLDVDGGTREITLEPLLRYQMKGTGYGHPAWRHGTWKGELALGADRWQLDTLDPLALENLHIQQLVRCHSNGQTGIGVMEQLCIGPHAPSGFAKAQRWRPRQFRSGARGPPGRLLPHRLAHPGTVRVSGCAGSSAAPRAKPGASCCTRTTAASRGRDR
jgi:hypothetical protein